jgi:hypothetical protein
LLYKSLAFGEGLTFEVILKDVNQISGGLADSATPIKKSCHLAGFLIE